MRKLLYEVLALTPPELLADTFGREDPQLVAVLLAHVDPAAASQVLGTLPDETQADLIARVARMKPLSPDMVKRVEQAMCQKLAGLLAKELTPHSGPRGAAAIVNARPETAKQLMEAVKESHADAAEAVRPHVLLIDDLLLLREEGVQRLLRDVEMGDLALALKSAPAPVRDHVLKNTSARTQAMLREELEFRHDASDEDLAAAQHALLTRMRELAQAGELVIHR
jgi:flagellar motor switch protein FliG